MDEVKLIFVQGHECMYNLQHKDYNNLVKDNNWKEIAGEWQGRGRVGMVYVTRPLTRQGNGVGMAWERHGMCESAFSVLCLVAWSVVITKHHATGHNTPIHNILRLRFN
jgi:hypothetical protein